MTRSLSFLHYYEYFCIKGGNEAFLRAANNSEANVDVILNVEVALASSSFLVPRMAIYKFLPSIL